MSTTSDEVVREAIRHANAPVTVELDARWKLRLLTDGLSSEIRKTEGTLKRSKHLTTRTQMEKRIESLNSVLAAVENAYDAS